MCYLGQWFGAGVQFASMDVKLGPFVPESPRIQQVAVVFDPALDSGVFQHFTWGTLLEENLSQAYFTFSPQFTQGTAKYIPNTNRQCILGQNNF